LHKNQAFFSSKSKKFLSKGCFLEKTGKKRENTGEIAPERL
jgi:hypothetical protein